MATRTVTGTIKNHSEAAVAGVEVSFLPIGDTYDSEGHYTGTHITDTTDVAGEISVSLHTGQRYEVSTVGGIQFHITVPAGDGDLTLEGLRAAEEAATTEVNAVQTAIDAALALLELNDLTDVLITEQPDDGMVLTYDLGSNQWVPLAGGGGSVAWGDVTGTPTTLAGYGITDAAAAVHTHDDRYYTEAEVTSLIANFITQAQGDVRYGQLGAANTWALAQTFTGQVLASSGTQAAPGIAFSGDVDTGLHRAGSNHIVIVTANNYLMEFTTTSLTAFRPLWVNWNSTGTNTTQQAMLLRVDTSGVVAAGYGAHIAYQLETSTTIGIDAGSEGIYWTTPTHASRTSRWRVQTVYNAGSAADTIAAGRTGVAASTALWLFREATGALEQVLEGAADSGGAGRKALTVAN